ncbi:MAG: hypothetical protein RMJ37_01265 [Spirochaetia bacterium]|nr:hypothetical protein [Spirochaetota bacterium]MDW8111952.1 hypothetical protein [Spirochaetia bacterium]
MKHKIIREEIEDYILGHKTVSSKTLEHLNECEECRNYLRKIKKLSRGLEKIRLQKHIILQNITISLDKKQKFRILGISLLIRRFRYIVIELITIIVLFAGYISFFDGLKDGISYRYKIDKNYVDDVYILLENNSSENQEIFQTIFDSYVDDQKDGSFVYPDYAEYYFSFLED